MLKKIDRYIIGKYLTTFFVAIFLILALAVVFDVSEKLDNLMGRGDLKPTFVEIMRDYYLNFMIFFANLFTPLFAFISVIFFTSRMASRLEIISVLSTGTSYRRLMVPFIFAASLLAALNWVSANYVIPKANLAKMEFEQKFFGRRQVSAPNLHRQLSDSEYVYVKTYNYESEIGTSFAYELFGDGQLKRKIMCHSVVYDTINGSWRLQDYIIRDMNGLKEVMRRGNQLDTVFSFNSDIFKQDLKRIITMSNSELNDFIDEERAKGSKYINIYLLEKHQRNANPFTIIIMTLLAVPVASRKVRGGIGFHLAMGVALAFTFIYIGKIFNAYASKGSMDPFWAVWLPNVIYGLLAMVLVRFTQK